MHERITVIGGDGPFPGRVARPSSRIAPGVVVAHDIFGMDADTLGTCAEIANLGYAVVCPDLFWRSGAGVTYRDACASDMMETLTNFAAFDVTKGRSDLEATLSATECLDGVNGHVGLVGFGLGGLLACLVALRQSLEVTVAYEAAGLEQHLDHVDRLPTPLLLHLAGDDEFAPWAVQQEIIAALDPIAHVEIEVYPGCRHGFTRRSGTAFDPASAARAFACTAEFLRAHLLGDGPRG